MKKRVAIYYESRLGRNDGAPLYYYNLLRDETLYPNIEAVHLIPNGDYAKEGKFDLNLWIDWGEDGLTAFLPYKVVIPTGAPLVYFASDTHLGHDYRLEMAKKADFVFVAQKPAIESFKAGGIKNPIWLPHAVEPRAYPAEPRAIKKYDICFVGNLVSQNRIDFLDRMFKEFPNFWFGQRVSRYIEDRGLADDAADIYKKSKIVLNHPTKDDLNMRHFEGLATASFMLTEKVPGIEDFFQDGVHMVFYKDVEEAVEKAKYYLEHDAEREKIAEEGMKEVLDKHTWKHRLDVILKEAGIV